GGNVRQRLRFQQSASFAVRAGKRSPAALADLWVSTNPGRPHLHSHVLRNLLRTPLSLLSRKAGHDFVVNRETQIRGEASAVQLHQSPAGDVPARALHHVVQSCVGTVLIHRQTTARGGYNVALPHRLLLELLGEPGNARVRLVEAADNLLGLLHADAGLSSHGLSTASIHSAEVHGLGVLALRVILLNVLTDSRASGRQVEVSAYLERLDHCSVAGKRCQRSERLCLVADRGHDVSLASEEARE